jgi:nucleotide-binding universal stress UspA family protein
VTLKILVVIDEKPIAAAALRAAAVLTERLNAELTVITIRPGTLATENPPSVGVEISACDRRGLPESIRALLEAMDLLAEARLIKLPLTIQLHDLPYGYLFFAEKATGERVFFKERFGYLIDELNQEIAENQHELVVIAVSRGCTFGRFSPANLPRQLALNLHCSFLVVRGGNPDDRYMICADGSPSSLRIFPFFKKLLPAIRGRIDVVCTHKLKPSPDEVQQAKRFLDTAKEWLTRCEKKVNVSQPRGSKRHELILYAAGNDSIIVMGESHKHDLRRRTLGTLPMKVMARTDSSFLMVKQSSTPDPEMFEGTYT